jgi:signal transduction histidine kinase
VKRILFSKDENGELGRPAPSRRSLTPRQVTVYLSLAFGVLAALLIAAGDLGLRRMDSIEAGLRGTMSEQWIKLRLTREANSYSNRNSRITIEIFLLEDRKQIDALLVGRAENTRKISDLVADLKGHCKSNDENRLLAAVEDARGPYIDSYLRALHLLNDEGDRKAAVSVMVGQTAPALQRYLDAWDRFVRFQVDQLEQETQRSKTDYAAARRLAMLILVFAVVAPCSIALFGIRRLVKEITIRMRDEQQALRDAHRAAEVFINAMPSILIGLDQGLRITRWNLAAGDAFRLSGADVVGRPLGDCGIAWLRPDMQDEFRSWLSVQGSIRCDQAPFELDGGRRLLGLTITPVCMADESLTKLLVVGADITNRRTMEAQLREAQKLESIGQLAAGIAHEINTPTQYIGDNVRFLKDAFQDLKNLMANYERLLLAAQGNGPPGEDAEGISATIDKSDLGFLIEEIPKAIDQSLEGVTRVSAIVGAMKEFSHPGTTDKTPLDMNHAIQSTITVSRNEWKYVADMETDFDPSLPLVSCLPGEINQVILNLIVNAAHAIGDVARQGGRQRGTITVRTRRCAEWAEIRIEDTGTGIPVEARTRVFDPFFTTKEVGKGTGQGLAIARSVVVGKHGGSLHFETEEGKGTAFIIRLPYDGKAAQTKAVAA